MRSPDAAEALAQQLRGLHVVLAALETSVQAQHWHDSDSSAAAAGAQLPPVAVMRAASPLLEGLAGAGGNSLRASEAVMTAAAHVYGVGVRACQAAATPLVQVRGAPEFFVRDATHAGLETKHAVLSGRLLERVSTIVQTV